VFGGRYELLRAMFERHSPLLDIANNRRRLVEPMARDLVAVYLDVPLGDFEIRRG